MKSTVVSIPSSKIKQIEIELVNDLAQIERDYSNLFEQIKELETLLLFIRELDKNPQKKEEMRLEQQALQQKASTEEKLTAQEEQRLSFLKKLELGNYSTQIDKLAIEFGDKVITSFSLMQLKAKAIGMEIEKLPDFIKTEDLKIITQVIGASLHMIVPSDIWLRRLLGVKADTSSQKLKAKLQEFVQTEIETRVDKGQLLPALSRFEKDILKEFNAYSRELKLANNLIKSFEKYSDAAGNRFQVAVHNVLNQLSILSKTLVAKEESRFQKSDAYKKISGERDKRAALIAHIGKFEELLPVEERLQFIERILNSQKSAKFTGENAEDQRKQHKEDKKTFAPLFKNKQFIRELSELHKAFKAVQSARVAYLKAEEKADKPEEKADKLSRKRAIEEKKVDYGCIRDKRIKTRALVTDFFSKPSADKRSVQEDNTVDSSQKSSRKRPVEETPAEQKENHHIGRKRVKVRPAIFFEPPSEKKPEHDVDVASNPRFK
ncbi:hypothetical protein [Legionella clemsonensis]|uniref:Uncharacterized protein n=1 Tax=Legionella clemsonensis TaxID=1867846 RepID=A0A222P0F1_9GAMM|nr:hypothetical protein [Legionella clemsonensis]ASQ45308.1 hypothetical protein clem_03750 [Legionella clemsonensis]